jgi:antagonist of KipI
MMTIRIEDPGFATTVQDLGRYGHAHLGISPAGAADSLSFRIANLLCGNEENAPALEMTLLGATVHFDQAAIVAIAGAECGVELDGSPISPIQAFEVKAGSTLKCGRTSNGARTYVAFQGGLDVPLVLGSASTHLAARFGGLQGRVLRKGDRLQVRKMSGLCKCRLRDGTVAFAGVRGETTPVRVTRGAQQDWFEADGFTALCSSPYIVTEQCGRTGLRLKGERILPWNTSQLLTDGIPLGAIQVPPEGQPIILFIDQQTTGGYPKIANVIAASMHLIGQLRPGDAVRFQEVSIEEAVQQLRDQESWLKTIFESESK